MSGSASSYSQAFSGSGGVLPLGELDRGRRGVVVGHKEQARAVGGARGHLAAQAFQLPQRVAGQRVIGGHILGRVQHELETRRGFDAGRRRPGDDSALDRVDLVAVGQVERDQAAVGLAVVLHQQQVLKGHQRRRVPVVVFRHAEVLAPDQLPVEVHAGQIAVGEYGAGAVALHRHGGRRETGLLADFGRRVRRAGEFLQPMGPEQLPAVRVETVDLALLLRRAAHEDAVVPHHGRIGRGHRNVRLPFDVLARRHIPLHRGGRKLGHTVAAGAAESGPVLLDRRPVGPGDGRRGRRGSRSRRGFGGRGLRRGRRRGCGHVQPGELGGQQRRNDPGKPAQRNEFTGAGAQAPIGGRGRVRPGQRHARPAFGGEIQGDHKHRHPAQQQPSADLDLFLAGEEGLARQQVEHADLFGQCGVGAPATGQAAREA